MSKHSSNPPHLQRGGLTSSNLARRVGMKYFLERQGSEERGGLFRKGEGGGVALT